MRVKEMDGEGEGKGGGVSVVKPRRRRCTEQSAGSVALATAGSLGAVPLLRVAICGNIANDEVAPVMGPQGPHRCNV